VFGHRHVRWLVVAAALAILAGPATATVAAASPPDPQAVIPAHFALFEAAVNAAIAKAQASPYASNPLEVADAAEYVRQIAQLVLDNQLIASDPLHPQLFRDPDPFSVPFGADPPSRSGIYNPDNINYVGVINGADQYRITGRRGNSDDLSFQVISGFPGDGTTGTPTTTLQLSQLVTNPDGSYTVHIGPTPQPGNWLPTVPATSVVSIRETFNNWTTAVPDPVSIERVDVNPGPEHPLSTDQIVAAIDAATNEVTLQNATWLRLWGGTLGALPKNLVLPPRTTVGGLPTQVSTLVHFDLAPGQALVVSVAPSDAAFQGFEAADVWGQTLPYSTHESSLNAKQAQVGSDGRIHYVVSGTDPGVPNWIDTEGHQEGFLFLRWQGLKTTPLPAVNYPVGTVVNLSDLSAVLPADTPIVTPIQRAFALFIRDYGVARRIVLSSNDAVTVLQPALQRIQDAVGTTVFSSVYDTVVLGTR
jgi:Protein of unknown function (DUF1214)